MIFTFLMSKVKLNFQGFFRRFFFFHFWQLPVLETLFMMFLRWVDNVESLCKIGKIDYIQCFQQLLSDDLSWKLPTFFCENQTFFQLHSVEISEIFPIAKIFRQIDLQYNS